MSHDDLSTSRLPLIKGASLLAQVKQHQALVSAAVASPSLDNHHHYDINHAWLPLYISIITAFSVTILYLMVVTFRRMYSNVKSVQDTSAIIGEDQPLRKVRCTSMCVDMENVTRKTRTKSVCPPAPPSTQQRSNSCDGRDASRLVPLLPVNHSGCSGGDHKLNLQDLPSEILTRVFSNLSPESKNSVARVCLRFSKLIRTGDCWTVVDLTTFPRPTTSATTKAYDRQMRDYLRYLTSVRPKLEVFRMTVDSGRHYAELTDFVKSIRGQRLRVAHLNWVTLESADKDKRYALRRRSRNFYPFFKHLVKAAPDLRHLVVPYDWSDPFLRHLAAMKNLRTLVLQRFSLYEPNFSQHSVQQVLSVLTHICHLELSVNFQTVGGYFSLTLKSNSLRELDIGQTSGIYLSELDMPLLRRLRVSTRPWNRIPYFDADQPPSAPCMLGVLHSGTPRLRYVNDSPVDSDDAHNLVCSVCACETHKDKLWIPNVS